MSTITLNCPEEVLISMKKEPADMGDEICLAAAMKLYELGKLSSGRAAQLAGVSRVEFLHATGRYHVPAFTLTEEELQEDSANA